MASNDLVTPVFGGMSTEMISIVSLIVGGTLISLIAMIGGFLHYRREWLLMHAERMRALELGREMPDDAATARLKAVNQAELAVEAASSPGAPKSLAAQCYSTTGWVAGCGLMFAVGASAPGGHSGVSYAIAGAAGAIGVTGMICGTILASKSTVPKETETFAHAKPRFDPEAV